MVYKGLSGALQVWVLLEVFLAMNIKIMVFRNVSLWSLLSTFKIYKQHAG